MKKTRFLAFLLAAAMMTSLMSACDSDKDDEGEKTVKITEAPAEELDDDSNDELEYLKEAIDFIYTPDGVEYQAVAYRAAMAYLRADEEELSQYLLDPGYEVNGGALKDGSMYDITDEIDYILLMLPNPILSRGETKKGLYRTDARISLKGRDSVFYISMVLNKTDDGWKARDLFVEG